MADRPFLIQGSRVTPQSLSWTDLSLFFLLVLGCLEIPHDNRVFIKRRQLSAGVTVQGLLPVPLTALQPIQSLVVLEADHLLPGQNLLLSKSFFSSLSEFPLSQLGPGLPGCPLCKSLQDGMGVACPVPVWDGGGRPRGGEEVSAPGDSG